MTNVTDRERKIKRLRRGNVPWTGRPTSGWQTMGEPLVMLMMANNDVDHDNWLMVQRKVMAPWKKVGLPVQFDSICEAMKFFQGMENLNLKTQVDQKHKSTNHRQYFYRTQVRSYSHGLRSMYVSDSLTNRLRTLLKIEWNGRCWLGYLVKRWGLACILRNMQHRENMQNMHNI